MENQKGNGLIIALVTFIIISILFGGYIVYDKLNDNKKDSSEIDTIVPENTSNSSSMLNNTLENLNTVADIDATDSDEESNQVEKQSQISVTEFSFDSVAIVSEGSVYVNVYGSTPEIDNLFGNDTFQTLLKTRNKYKEYTFNNFEYYKNNGNFKGMKLNADNIEKVYSYEYGQEMADNYGLILLNKDKTLSIISLYSLINGKVDVKNISNLSNIENIVSEDDYGMITYAVKQNGEKVDLSNYIPQDYKQF